MYASLVECSCSWAVWKPSHSRLAIKMKSVIEHGVSFGTFRQCSSGDLTRVVKSDQGRAAAFLLLDAVPEGSLLSNKLITHKMCSNELSGQGV